uniref:Uncharacterized protein n=1 Tax=Solanum tuberosum TaxID=4113 RepID=M1DLD7_SOLTU
MPIVVDMEIENVIAPLRDKVTHCKELVESHKRRLDDLTTRLEVEEKDHGSSSVLDTIRGQLITLRVFRFSASRSRSDRFLISSLAVSVGYLGVTYDPRSRVRVSGVARGVTNLLSEH